MLDGERRITGEVIDAADVQTGRDDLVDAIEDIIGQRQVAGGQRIVE